MLSKFGSHLRHNVVAYLALFVALGGTAVAADKVPIFRGDSAGGDLTGTYPNPTIAASKVTGAKVADDSLTGDDILESSLGKVPSATSADTATSAADSDKLDGKDSTAFGAPTRGFYANSTGDVTLGAAGGLDVTVESKLLPAGKYALSASITGFNNSTTSRNVVQCSLDDTSLRFAAANQVLEIAGAVTLPLVGTTTLPTATTISMTCKTLSGPGPVTISGASAFIAVEVDSID